MFGKSVSRPFFVLGVFMILTALAGGHLALADEGTLEVIDHTVESEPCEEGFVRIADGTCAKAIFTKRQVINFEDTTIEGQIVKPQISYELVDARPERIRCDLKKQSRDEFMKLMQYGCCSDHLSDAEFLVCAMGPQFERTHECPKSASDIQALKTLVESVRDSDAPLNLAPFKKAPANRKSTGVDSALAIECGYHFVNERVTQFNFFCAKESGRDVCYAQGDQDNPKDCVKLQALDAQHPNVWVQKGTNCKGNRSYREGGVASDWNIYPLNEKSGLYVEVGRTQGGRIMYYGIIFTPEYKKAAIRQNQQVSDAEAGQWEHWLNTQLNTGEIDSQ